MYAFPPAAILGKVVEKLQDSPCKRIILIAPGRPNRPWFGGSNGHVKSDSTESAQPVNTALKSDPSQKSENSESPYMAPRATAIKEQGFSEAVAARIEAPQRGSIRSVNDPKWCITNRVNFRAPLLNSVADFLMYLFLGQEVTTQHHWWLQVSHCCFTCHQQRQKSRSSPG